MKKIFLLATIISSYSFGGTCTATVQCGAQKLETAMCSRTSMSEEYQHSYCGVTTDKKSRYCQTVDGGTLQEAEFVCCSADGTAHTMYIKTSDITHSPAGCTGI